MNGNDIYTYLIVFLAVFLPYVAVQFAMENKQKGATDANSRNLPGLYLHSYWILAALAGGLGKSLAAMQPKRTQKIRNQLILANIRMDETYVYAAEFLFCLLGLLVPSVALLLLSGRGDLSIGAGVLFGVIGGIYPSMVVASAAEKRQERLIKNLPFAIDLIGSAMRAGLDFSAAVRYYTSSETSTNPLAVEFGVMLRQMELGKTRVEALEDMNKRVQTDEFQSFTAAVAHGTEIGASIVETMAMQAEEMRRARFNRAERKAARAPSIMIFPIAVFIMPAIFVVIGTPVLIRIMDSGVGAMMK